jgi:hypothetical protein
MPRLLLSASNLLTARATGLGFAVVSERKCGWWVTVVKGAKRWQSRAWSERRLRLAARPTSDLAVFGLEEAVHAEGGEADGDDVQQRAAVLLLGQCV